MITIGFLESNSIARGVEAADAMLKAAEVKLVVARPSCPGKYHIMISGEVSAVQSAMDAGKEKVGGSLIDELVIPRVHPQVIEAINLATMPEKIRAIGVMEYFSVVQAVIGADAAVKAAGVELIEVRLGTGIGGKSFVVLTGDVSAVEASVQAGTKDAIENGLLISQIVIAHPHPDLVQTLL
ncbi:BMC domain-containing protein [Pseudobutyrivibrio xylanivorans]|uniref:BMC domain-containing protein n=1 Tax=Pseudobutyrivibrio xylanivorans TaxID=185007 RepID=A0A5P6VSB8_PSEXY|nr:BMC domain-containing protein [Pseudobutyrivibrio xylanivorans]QFJ54609.1 BMC domain-containing protein [Pseudobutyrivibrio xylanivorans]